MDTSNANIETLKKLSHTLQAIKWELGWSLDINAELQEQSSWKKWDVIQDETIVSLQKKLRNKDVSVEDLFSDDK